MTEKEDLFDLAHLACGPTCSPEQHAHIKLAMAALVGVDPKVAIVLLMNIKIVTALAVNMLVSMEAVRQSPEWFEAVIRKMHRNVPEEFRARLERAAREFIEQNPVALSEALPS